MGSEVDLDKVDLSASCMSLNLSISRLGQTKKVKTAKLDETDLGDLEGKSAAQTALEEGVVLTDAEDPKLVRASKRILGCPTLKQIGKHDGETRFHVRTHSIQHLLRHGMHFVPIAAVETMEDYLIARSAERDALVEQLLVNEYEAGITNDEASLGHLFNRNDYLSVEQARERFSLSWEWLEFKTPDKLRSISPKMFEREREKAKAGIQSAAESIVASTREGALALLRSFSEKLGEPEPGKRKKQIAENSIERYGEFFQNLKQLLTVTGDTDLEALADKAQDVLKGITVKELRSDDDIRDAVHQEFAALIPEAEKLVVDAPRRKIVFTQAELAVGEPADDAPAALAAAAS